jgi:murein L,D-transpeptidase YafK
MLENPVRRRTLLALPAMALLLSACSSLTGMPRDQIPLTGSALKRLADIGATPASPMLVRIFKQSSELEVWRQSVSGEYRLFRTYRICKWSGTLGPKFAEGDGQAPEGFYTVTPGMMNPNSKLYLSFNTGFPNKYDRAYGRTGSNLMVHGDCRSVGCYAMTDEQIREIYGLARDAFAGGNASFALEMYPFRMTDQNMKKFSDSPFLGFWQNLKDGYDVFEAKRRPAKWDVCDGRYVFDIDVPSGGVLQPMAPCPPSSRSALPFEVTPASASPVGY